MSFFKKTHQIIKLIFLFLGVLLGTSFGMNGIAQEIGLSVIANEEGVPDGGLTTAELKKIYLGQKKSWGNRKVIKIAMLNPDTKVGAAVSDKLYGMTPNELKKYWLVMTFQGRAKSPEFFNSVDELRDYITTTKGSIGIIEYAIEENLNFVLVDKKNFF